MEHINAPYNFVPLSDKVVTPEWAAQVSQDLPFRDGISGELALTITAQTNILVGGRKDEADDKAKTPGSVHFFQMENGSGKYAIPGSSLRGMIRNVMEIATFSQMNAVDDRSFGLRDVSTGSVYAQKAIGPGKVKTGFLKRDAQGHLIITPCKVARLDHRDLERWLGLSRHQIPIFNNNKPKQGGHKRVSDKYRHWASLSSEVLDAQGCIKFDVEAVQGDNYSEDIATQLGSGQIHGLPVFTGQISDCRRDTEKKTNKHKDFIFYDEKPQLSFDVDAFDSNAWRDFLFIHNDASDTSDTDESWPNHWRDEFRAGCKVPVFYIQSEQGGNKQRLQIGLAFLPKLAGDFSIYELIRHTSKSHLAEKAHDFTSLIFGAVGKESGESLKGRVSFEPAVMTGDQSPEQNPEPTILNGAKPSYFPNYLEQDVDDKGTRLKATADYATYLSTAQNPNPKIRGWKRYPARANYSPQELDDDQKTNHRVQTRLHTLPANTIFKGRLVFHNLKPSELGALLWCLRLENRRHSLGMGKSFGAGQVKVEFDWNKNDSIYCNDDALSVEDEAFYLGVFKKYMTKAIGDQSWVDSNQIKHLLVMSDDEQAVRGFKGELRHMRLSDYADAKKQTKQVTNRFVLAAMKISGSIRKTIIPMEQQVWERATIRFQPGVNILNATLEQSATMGKDASEKADAKAIFDGFSNSAKSKAKKGTLVKSVEVKRKGNEFTLLRIID